jgi:tetratricopeptide (TPR) repeat protein
MPPVRERNGSAKGASGDRKNVTEATAPPAAEAEGKLREPVAAAVRAVNEAPGDMTAWDRLEEAAVEHESPAAVGDAYRKAMRQPHGTPLLMELGERAVRFHQEWLADRPASLIDILQRVLEIEPATDWALKRLIVVLTLEENWDQLLAAYDRALGAITERGRRVQLLEEAAQVAKDFVGNADHAIGYLQKLFALKPNDWQVAGALERLLERQERWSDLVTLWRARLEGATGDEVRTLHVRIATTQIERLGAPHEALAETQRLLEEPGDDSAAIALAERLVALETSPVSLRLQALRLVEARYDRNGKQELALAVVRAGLAFTTGRDLAALHRDAAARLASSGAEREAAGHLASLLGLCPEDVEVQDQLRRLCAQIGDHGAYAQGLAAAATNTGDGRRRVSLLLEAGHAQDTLLGDAAAAITFYTRARREPEADAAERLRAMRRLDELLDKTGRNADRLEVLDLLADHAPRPVERRNTLGALARLATRENAVDRAVGAWLRCLEMDPPAAGAPGGPDREALDGLVDVLAAAERWQPLVDALRRRMTAVADAHQQREDIQRIARVQSEKLADPVAAIRSWSEHEITFGPSVIGVDALVGLLATTGHWPELGALLNETAVRDRTRAADLGSRLGDTCRVHLSTPDQAALWYRRALEADPAHAGARAGLVPLLEIPSSRAAAASALLAAATETDDWRLTLSLVEPRLAVAPEPEAQAVVLREAARLLEQRADDRPGALAALCRALPLQPDDHALEGEALRLAGETGDFAALERAVAGGIVVSAAGSRRRVELLALRGDLCESRLADPAQALLAYREALEAEPGRLDLRRLVIRAAGRVSEWNEVARATLTPLVSAETRRQDLLPLAESMAAESGFAGLASAVARVLAETQLSPAAACEIENRVATWYADSVKDPRAAEAALVRALEREPDDLPTLRRLADVRRANPGEALFTTLLHIAALAPGDLDPLAEATEIARALPLDRARTLETASRLLDQSGRLLRLGTKPEGKRSPEDTARVGIDTLVAGYLQTGTPEDCRRAIGLQIEGAALPLGADTRRTLRRSAAELAEERLGDRALAIDIRRVLADEQPGDPETIEALAKLYAGEDRLVDLSELRRRQLEKTVEAERRLTLRLEIERLGAVLEERSDRVALLRANLGERPGHVPTVDAIAAVLTAKRRHGDLADVLEDQATRVEDRGEAEAAAALWIRLARLAEDPLADRRRAIRAHERTAALAPAGHPDWLIAALDALGRLCMVEGDAEAAARWLDRRLTMAEAGEAPAIALLLARAYLACDRRHRAVACLERALEQQPASREVRALLGELYRASSAWEPLARLLTDATGFITDREELLATAREAHRLWTQELGAADKAVPALERAATVAPDETELSMGLAVAFTAASRLDDARALLKRMLKATRRSKDRGAIHFQLGRVARAQGDAAAALAAFEQASAVDMENTEILSLLADTAREAGQNERAERAYRGLLMLLRRSEKSGGEGAAAPTAPAVSIVETLLALYELASGRGETDKAAEVLDSAFEAAAHDAAEFTRLRERLGKRGELAALASALDKRAAAAKTPSAQADAYREIAEVRTQLGDDTGAFEALLQAVHAAPEDDVLHTRTRAAARAAGATERYLAVLEAAVDRRRRRDDGPLVARLLIAAGDIIEKDLKDAKRALSIYRRAAEIGDLPAEAATALARVGAACDPAERARALDRLGRIAREALTPAEQADALYRLAEAQLGAPDTREAGLVSLAAAMERTPTADDPKMLRALSIVRDAVVPHEELHKVLPLYERLARASGDDRMLLDCLERRALSREATIEAVREGYDLANSLAQEERAEALLARVIELGRATPGAGAEATWGLLERAKRRRAAGDLGGAHAFLAEALEVGDAAAILPLLRDLAAEAAKGTSDASLALSARIYETLRARTPADPQLWGTLLDIYTRMGDREALGRVVGETLQQLAEPQARNQVRMRFVQFLRSRDGDDATAVETLRDVLLDEPDHEEAATRLADLYERTGEEGLLAELLDHRRHTLAERGDREGVRAVALKLARLLTSDRPDEAVEVLGWALKQAPGDSELVAAVLGLLPDDVNDPRARAVETVLAAQPRQEQVRAAREERYRAGEMWEPLAHLLVEAAATETSPKQAAARLREAAGIYKGRLFDFSNAVELLRKVRALDPTDVEVVRELAASLVDLGEPQKALSEMLTACRAPGLPRDVRAKLLRLRAEMLIEHGQRDAAISVLLEALAYSTADAKQEILAMVDKLRAAAAAGAAVPTATPVEENTDRTAAAPERSQH